MELRSEINVKNKDDIIPKDWIPIRLGELADITSSKRIFAKEYSESGIPFYRGKEIIEKFNGKKISEDLYIKKSKYQEIKEKYGVPEEGDMLLTSVGTLGIPYLVKKHEKFYFKDGNLTWFRNFNDKVNNYFVYYWIISDLGRKQLECHKIGSTQQALTIEGLKNFKINLPSNQEQDVIIEILSSLDDKIELNRKINSNLEKIASLLFKQWFVDFEFPNNNGESYKSSGGKMIDSELGEIPEGWKISKIGDELNTILGGTPRRNNDDYWYNGNIPWINSGAINNFPIIESSEFITKKGLDSSATKLMPVKTVVLPFVISLGKEIKISILGIETSGNQSVLGIIENERFSAEYIYYWIEKNKNSIYGWATGGAQQHINKQNVDGTSILIPPKDIMDKFRVITVPIFDNIISNSILNKQVEKLRDSLLPRLMSGKIRVNKKYE